MTMNSSDSEMDRLLSIMVRLRHPSEGCPWDREQDFASISPHTIEEAYEVADAIQRGDLDDLRDELGDLLFQVVYHARMAEEVGSFDFRDVARGVADKLVRRHPHVFGEAQVETAQAQTHAWEAHKAAERQAKAVEPATTSHLDGVSVTLPAMTRAVKLQRRAARTGFDWPDAADVLPKLSEELEELTQALQQGESRERVAGELGDLLFTCANLARHLELDPEVALRAANGRFEQRFRRMEVLLRSENKSVEAATLAEMDAAWERAKAQER